MPATYTDQQLEDFYCYAASSWRQLEPALNAGLDCNQMVRLKPDQPMRPLLASAAKNAAADVVERLLARGAKVDQLDEDGFTPLMHAIKAPRFQAEIVKLLLAAGADRSILRKGKTALDLCKDDDVRMLLGGEPLPDSPLARARVLIARHLSAPVRVELDGKIFDDEPSNFSLRFCDPKALRLELADLHTDEMEMSPWCDAVPVAAVSVPERMDEEFAWVFLSFKKKADPPSVLVATSDNWSGKLRAKSLEALLHKT